ncbi:hypothetical protein ACJJTC_014821 [Scirpophaga incertulas]
MDSNTHSRLEGLLENVQTIPRLEGNNMLRSESIGVPRLEGTVLRLESREIPRLEGRMLRSESLELPRSEGNRMFRSESINMSRLEDEGTIRIERREGSVILTTDGMKKKGVSKMSKIDKGLSQHCEHGTKRRRFESDSDSTDYEDLSTRRHRRHVRGKHSRRVARDDGASGSVANVEVEVQGIKKNIDIFIVEDYVLSYPALLGHSFTELPDIVITKTPDKLIFERIDINKIHLFCNTDVALEKGSLGLVSVKTEPEFSGCVYVHGSLRGIEGKEYYLFSGEYEMKRGQGSLLIYNASQNGITIVSKSEGILGQIISDTTKITSPQELGTVRDRASENIKEQQLKDSERFNRNRKPGTKYVAGDLVRVERQIPHDGKSQKLAIKFQGPYRITKVLPNDRYLIEDTPMTRKHGRRYEAIVAVDKIHPWLIFRRDLTSSEDNCSNSNSENELDF